jgi:Relaxase/Mobilisation nuclease domain
MVPAETDPGRSFKGAALYYLHDKRQAGEAERLTTERVAWTHTLNLATDDPERAWRIMASTAMSQAELKAAAGEKATGRKLTKPVYAYSLSWHPEQRPDRDHMLSTALESLKAQGLEGYQAVIVAHSDEPHQHVHVILNRVHPETGIAATLSNSKLKLSKWAEAYEKQHGKIYCNKRVENNHKRKQHEAVREKRKPRAAYEFDKAAGNDSLSADFIKSNEKQKDAQLYDIGRAIKEAHARQWEELKRVYAGSRKKINDHGQTLKTAKAAQVKDGYRERWTMLAQTQRAERRELWGRENGFLSRLFNGLSLLKEIRQNHEGNAFLIALSLMSRNGHIAALATRHEAERRDLAREIRDVTSREIIQIDKGNRTDLDRLRGQFLGQCAALRTTQDKEHGEQRGRWTARNAERKEALAPYRSRRQRDTSRSHDTGRSRGRDRHTEQSAGRRGPGMRPANAPATPPAPDKPKPD